MSSNPAATPAGTTASELLSLLVQARALHRHLSDQVVDVVGLDPQDVKARYGKFSDTVAAPSSPPSPTGRRKNPHRLPEPMLTPLSGTEKRKMRLLLRALRATDSASPVAKTTNVDELRGTLRASLSLLERFVLSAADVAESDDDDDASTSGDDGGEGDAADSAAGGGGSPAADVAVQTAESSVPTAKLASRLLTGDAEEARGGLKSRRFPHAIPQPPYPGVGPGAGAGGPSQAHPAAGAALGAGQHFLAVAFRPPTLRALAARNAADDGAGASEDADGALPGGWSPSFFPVDVQFVPRSQRLLGVGAASAGTGDGRATTGANALAGAVSGTTAIDLEGGARLVIRRLPVARDGQRIAATRADSAAAVVTDVGCAALRSVVLGQASRYFLRGRQVLSRKADAAKRWEWRVPAPLVPAHMADSAATPAAGAASSAQRVPLAVDLTSLPSMTQLADRSLSLGFVDPAVLNVPATATDRDEDTALLHAVTRASAAESPAHVRTAPPNFVPAAGAELALVFPSHAEFNTFLGEAMHWCADFSAFRYGREADYHSPDLLRNLPDAVRAQWQSLDAEELAFCEEFHVPPSVFLTARRRVTASSDAARAVTSADSLLCEEDLSAICDVDYLQLSAMIRFLQARGLIKLHSLYYVRHPM